MSARDFLLTFEQVVNLGPTQASKLLGVDYRGQYCKWKRGDTVMPHYQRQHAELIMELNDDQLANLKRKRLKPKNKGD